MEERTNFQLPLKKAARSKEVEELGEASVDRLEVEARGGGLEGDQRDRRGRPRLETTRSSSRSSRRGKAGPGSGIVMAATSGADLTSS